MVRLKLQALSSEHLLSAGKMHLCFFEIMFLPPSKWYNISIGHTKSPLQSHAIKLYSDQFSGEFKEETDGMQICAFLQSVLR